MNGGKSQMEDRGTLVVNETPALIAAVQDGNLAQVMRLVQQGHSLHERDKDGATALYWACSRGHVNISRFLIDAGSDVNARVKWGTTPLLAAADNGQEICTSQLLSKHADVNATNNRGDTPLHAAAYRGYEGVLCMLMEAGANPFLKNSASMTPMQEAFVQQKHGCVQRLQEYMNGHGVSGPISLPIPPQESDFSCTEGLCDQYRSWPYVPQSNRSRTSQTEQTKHSSSLRSQKMGIDEESKVHPLNYYARTRPLSETRQSMNSDLLQYKTQDVSGHKTHSADDLSSLHAIHYRNVMHLSDPTISEQASEGKCGNLLNPLSMPYKSGSQILYTSGNFGPCSPPGVANQEVTRKTPINNVHNLKQSESKKIQTVSATVPQDRAPNRNDLNDYARNVTHGVAPNTRPTIGLNEKSALEKRSGKIKHVSGKVMPGMNVSEFVDTLQFQLIELQEKLLQSNAMIAQLKDQLIDVQRENRELKTDNLHLRNLLHQRDLSSDLITRGTSEPCEGVQYIIDAPERLQSVARFVERSGFDGHVESRQAVESGECEDSAS